MPLHKYIEEPERSANHLPSQKILFAKRLQENVNAKAINTMENFTVHWVGILGHSPTSSTLPPPEPVINSQLEQTLKSAIKWSCEEMKSKIPVRCYKARLHGTFRSLSHSPFQLYLINESQRYNLYWITDPAQPPFHSILIHLVVNVTNNHIMNGPVSLGFETDSFDSSNTPNSKVKELWIKIWIPTFRMNDKLGVQWKSYYPRFFSPCLLKCTSMKSSHSLLFKRPFHKGALLFGSNAFEYIH